ncbi:FAD-dependent oxidoreductase [Streptomyces sp. NPDC087866]|uniref:FAD-dependent oxidoreductase n=1 Tax=Streptomyces sp. NPDC087866 TaxID=3365815 RepID=UPI0038061528
MRSRLERNNGGGGVDITDRSTPGLGPGDAPKGTAPVVFLWKDGCMDADVIIVGAGPTGMMLAGELRRAGADALLLERQQQLRETSRANGLGGQILELLRYRGMLTRLEAAATDPRPAPPVSFRGRAPGPQWPG